MSEPEHVTLAREAQEVGLTVTHLMPAPYGIGYVVQLWQPDGAPWVEGRDVSAAMIRAHIAHYPAHRQALEYEPHLTVVPVPGEALPCGCLTTDTTEEPS